MKELNLTRAIQASPFTDNLSLYEIEAIFDYFDDMDADLNTINVDDFIVNGTTYISREDYNALSDEKKEDIYILHDNESSDDIFIMSY